MNKNSTNTKSDFSFEPTPPLGHYPQQFWHGLNCYLNTDIPTAPITHQKIVHQNKSTTLYHYPNTGASVLLIPSLINGCEILDLLPDFSFARFLQEKGFDVYLLDWHKNNHVDEALTFDQYFMNRLVPAFFSIKKPCHIMGYCMGGLFATALAQLYHGQTLSLTLMGTPWDFSQTPSSIKLSLPLLTTALQSNKTSNDLIQNYILQSIFLFFDPISTVKKYTHFSTVTDTTKKHIFCATERWLNSGPPVSRHILQTTLQDFYTDNLTHKNSWTLANANIQPNALSCPVHIVTPRHDSLIPMNSALAFTQMLGDIALNITMPKTGHIGMMASINSKEQTWNSITDFLKKSL